MSLTCVSCCWLAAAEDADDDDMNASASSSSSETKTAASAETNAYCASPGIVWFKDGFGPLFVPPPPPDNDWASAAAAAARPAPPSSTDVRSASSQDRSKQSFNELVTGTVATSATSAYSFAASIRRTPLPTICE